MKPILLAVLVAFFWMLHQDFWFWRASDPLLFGFLPPALWYHGFYTLGAALLLALLVRTAWPAQLEREADPE